jgi:hypothetical protein
MTSKEETMELTEQELFDTEDLIRTVHKYELLDDRDGGIEAVTKFRKATEAKVREEYAGLVEKARAVSEEYERWSWGKHDGGCACVNCQLKAALDGKVSQ